MNRETPTFTHEGYLLRPARHADAEAYYAHNFCPLDPEAARLTGCRPDFTREQVVPFFHACIGDEDRLDLLLIARDGAIVGESVVNDIDWDARCANFRCAIFQPAHRGRGLVAFLIRSACAAAFDHLHLHRLELDVFAFNPRALHAYERAGFVREGVRRAAIPDGDTYADDILMAMLDTEWRARSGNC